MPAGIRFPMVGLPGSAEELRAEVREFLSCEITAGKAAAIAHQVHGAIGFTERHPLHESTRRLWAEVLARVPVCVIVRPGDDRKTSAGDRKE